MNKTVLITGASSGIGLELSIIFARNNYNLVLVSQNEENLEKAKSIIHKENTKIKIYSIAKDLSKTSAPKEIFEYTLKNSIQVDILVDNAGIQVYGNFHDANIEDIKLFRGQLLEASKVAEIGYEALMKGKSVVIPGLSNKIVAESIRFIPRSVVTKIGMNVMKK